VLSSKGPTFVLLDIIAVRGRPGPKSPGNAAERARVLKHALAS
jgi:hypothetical protein